MKKLSLTAALLILAAGSANAAIITHSYTFEDGTVDFGARTFEDTTGSLDGGYFGDATVSGGLLMLDGPGMGPADIAQLNGYALPTDGSDYSVEISAQYTGASTTGALVELLSQGSSGPAGMYIGFDSNGRFRLGDSLRLAGVTDYPDFPTDGAFHDYLLTTSMTEGTKFYVDNSLVLSATEYAAVVSGGTPTRFGRQFNPGFELFTGNIDSVVIYDGIVRPSTSVPEPASLLLLLVGGCGLIAAKRQRLQA